MHRLQKFPTNMELFSARIAALFLILPTVLCARTLSTQAILSNELLKQLLQARASAIGEVSNKGAKNERRENEMTDNDASHLLEKPDLFEGDIVAPKHEIDMLYGQTRNDYADIQKIHNKGQWDNGIVYYEWEYGFSRWKERIVEGAMREYEQKTCVKFEHHYPIGGTHLIITDRMDGCWASVGKQIGGQYLNIGEGCEDHATVLHELGHVLGFWHEQSRPDRDRYITVHRENIEEGIEDNFNVEKYANYQGEPFNYGSIMHYTLDAFSKNGKDTKTVSDEVLYELENKPNIGEGTTLTGGDTTSSTAAMSRILAQVHSMSRLSRLVHSKSQETTTFVCEYLTPKTTIQHDVAEEMEYPLPIRNGTKHSSLITKLSLMLISK